MIKRVSILCLAVTGLLLFTACGSSELQCTVINVPDTENVTFTVKEISLSGIKIKFDNNTDKYIYYGRSYTIEKLHGKKWKALELLDNNGIVYTFTDEAYGFNAAAQLTLDWSRLYGSLTKGRYRIILDDFYFAKNDEGRWTTAVESPTIEFEVE